MAAAVTRLQVPDASETNRFNYDKRHIQYDTRRRAGVPEAKQAGVPWAGTRRAAARQAPALTGASPATARTRSRPGEDSQAPNITGFAISSGLASGRSPRLPCAGASNVLEL